MDVIQEFLEFFGRIAERVQHKEDKRDMMLEQVIFSAYDLDKVLQEKAENGEICQGEDILFFESERDFNLGKYYAGLEFYDRIAKYDDEYLTAHNFSRAEIAEGMQCLNKLMDDFEQQKDKDNISEND